MAKVDTSEKKLLKQFNNRSVEAYTSVYSMYFTELCYYAQKIYNDTNYDAEDAVQDAFLKIWQRKNTNFTALNEIKTYLFVTIRNDFRNLLIKDGVKDKYINHITNENSSFEADIIESELFSFFNEIDKLLPADSAEIIRLFFEGWNAEEIAAKSGYSKNTIYNKKYQAIDILRKKVHSDKSFIVNILSLLN